MKSKITFLAGVLFLITATGYAQHPGLVSTAKSPASQVSDEIAYVQKNGYPIVSALPNNYVKDGTVDYTAAIQQALNQHRLVIFPPFPVLINDQGLTIHDYQEIYFPPGSMIQLMPSKKPGYEILRVHNVNHVKIFNPTISGDKNQHLGQGGEWGMGISIRGATDVWVYHPRIENCWGDGIYIGDANIPYSKNVYISGGVIANNRRNGISVIGADSLTIDSTVIARNIGTSPRGGIDIEPNTPRNVINHILISHVYTKENFGGILFGLKNMNNNKSPQSVHISLINIADSGSTYGLIIEKNSNNNGSKMNYITGQVVIDTATFIDNKKEPIGYEDYLASDSGPEYILSHIKIVKQKQDITIPYLQVLNQQILNTSKIQIIQ
ncbi:MAG: right-handed parallel beta-helix repeat-containing protein [Acidobacterium ailaaui]|nr:right-handed parallel beta-helix repeat-containing protein [Pseudacidobacterium ailaaui]